MKKKAGRIFYRILFTTLSLVLVMALINTVILVYMKNKLIEENISSMTSYINRNVAIVDEILDTGKSICLSFLNDQDLNLLITEQNLSLRDSVQAKQNISKKLTTSMVNYDFVSGIFIYMFYNDYVISSRGVIQKSTFFSNRFTGDEEVFFKNLELVHSISSFEFPDSPEGADTDSQVSSGTLTLLQTLRNGKNPYGTLIILLDRDRLVETISERLPANVQWCIIQKGRVILSDPSNSITPETLPSSPCAKHINGQGIVVRSPSERSSMTEYIIIEPESEIVPVYTTALLTANGIMILAAVILSLFSFWISRRLYSPISVLMQQISTDANFRTDEGEVLMQSLTALKQENSNMQNQLSSATTIIRDSLIFHLLKEPDSEDLEIIEEYLPAGNASGKFYAFVVNIWQDAPDAEYLYAYIVNRITKELNELIIAAIKTNETEYVFVTYPLNDTQYESFAQVFKESLKDIEYKFPGSKAVASTGAGCVHIDSIAGDYHTARAHIAQNPVTQNFIFIDKSIGSNSVLEFIPADMETILISMLKNDTTEHIWAYISSILQKNREKSVSEKQYIMVSYLINTVLYRYFLNINNGDQFNINDFIQIIPESLCVRYEQLDSIIHDNLVIISASSSQQRNSFTEIMAYIDEHLTENLSLSTVAESFGYNSSYFSRYFKQNAGVNFVNYINQKKVERACNLLKNTRETIKEIGEKFGWTSTNQFITTFERWMGLTPGQFRAQLRMDDSEK